MHRPLRTLAAALAVAALVAACSDSAVGPRGAAGSRSAPTVAAPFQLTESQLDSSNVEWVGSIQISPNGTSYADGVNAIVFPAGSVCDPATSGYGPELWDAPCAPITEPLTLTVSVYQHDGERHLVFSPDVRFAPTDDPAKMVILETNLEALTRSTAPNSAYTIFWSPDGVTTVDESQSDPSLVTQVYRDQGRLERRLKHFSGYQVAATVTCDPNAGSSCDAPPP